MSLPETPRLTVDIIIELIGQPDKLILLIERKNPPHGWALPGGFVDVGETLEQAAVREAAEEISLPVKLKTLLGCYSDPNRDSRMHTVSVVYVAEAAGTPKAADDTANVKGFNMNELPETLAFDHRLILEDYLAYLKDGRSTPLRSV